ncbi:hypothetical protein [Actinoplanes sp. NPDC051851]|uniref:hypothetical protein n=1 Tax=Actinoplanes sp. NPDC051851 TaxID=3154753 RepID=UPI003419812B
MVLAGTLAACAGFLLLGGAGIFLLLNLADRRAVRLLRRVPPAPIASIVPAALATPAVAGTVQAGSRPVSRGRFAAEGVTAPGPAGIQIAPVSGDECAWYSVRLTREPSRRDSDLSQDLLLEASAPDRPALLDATGRLPLSPALVCRPPEHPVPYVVTRLTYRTSAPVPLPALVPPDVVAGLRRSESLVLTETRLPLALPVFVSGRLTPDGLDLPRSGPAFCTTRPYTELHTALRADITLATRLILGSTALGTLLLFAATTLLHVAT